MGFKNIQVTREYKVTLRDTSQPVNDKPVMIAPIMRAMMLAPFESFIPLGTLGNEPEGSKFKGRHIYIDRGSKVLGVAHLDSVRSGSHFWCTNDMLACPTIDDRIGVWALLHGLPSIGIYPDVLLTENEEHGASTAADFLPTDKRWNWMFSFDRMGADAVYYQYDDGGLEKAMKKAGIVSGNGSYSCICELEHLGIEGVNVGCGMADYHSDKAHVHLPILSSQLLKFANVFREHEQTKFGWEKPKKWQRNRSKRQTTTTNYSGHGYYDEGGLFPGEDSYYMGPPNDRAHNARVFDLIQRFRRDADEVQRIMSKGLDKFMDDALTTAEWRAAHVIPDGAVGHGRVACKWCGYDYAYTDIKFSPFFGESYCKACYVERMDVLQIMPAGWQYELAVISTEGGL